MFNKQFEITYIASDKETTEKFISTSVTYADVTKHIRNKIAKNPNIERVSFKRVGYNHIYSSPASMLKYTSVIATIAHHTNEAHEIYNTHVLAGVTSWVNDSITNGLISDEDSPNGTLTIEEIEHFLPDHEINFVDYMQDTYDIDVMVYGDYSYHVDDLVSEEEDTEYEDFHMYNPKKWDNLTEYIEFTFYDSNYLLYDVMPKEVSSYWLITKDLYTKLLANYGIVLDTPYGYLYGRTISGQNMWDDPIFISIAIERIIYINNLQNNH